MLKFRGVHILIYTLTYLIFISSILFVTHVKEGNEIRSTVCNLNSFDVKKQYISNDILECLYQNIMDTEKSERDQLELMNFVRETEYVNYCHLLLHKLGKYYIKELKRPFKEVMDNSIPTCFDGFAHGVFENLAYNEPPTDELYTAIREFCNSYKTHLDVLGCYHSAGHYYYRGSFIYPELKNPFDGCRKLTANRDELGVCASGITMYQMISIFLEKGFKFDNCQKSDLLETVSCLLYPPIPFDQFDYYFKNSYCKDLPDYQQPVCEYGMVSHYADIMSVDQLINYCIYTSTAESMCLHHLVQQMTLSQGESKYNELILKLKKRNIKYKPASHEDIYLGLDAITAPLIESALAKKRFAY